ncbi:unnamed protein product [Rhizoctonia solani]|uniref:Uncharacterized protein n=2 Tax=Rhizoctonia solani TaxID=456999 RepID=A0A8H3C905_9AGAM|nr:hypothetical protein RSOL_434110 [Rhizoctonia solani AG-3 Rhs1AP]CAE6478277.1 unnamed protein product [Rhizoctonia solani]CAE6479056.1 unnamed protein product [Rhizoctonia solani]
MAEDDHIAARKLVRVPELLSIICTFMGPSECKEVASISRIWFLAATPVIWKDVIGIHHLLALFPDAEVKHIGVTTIIIRLPPSLDFTRFDIYAPLVKSLDLYGDSKHSYDFTGWGTLNQRQRPLLPYLSSLTMRGAGGSRGSGDQLMWTTLLASSTLREVRTVSSGKKRPTPSSVAPVTASLLLSQVVRQCPDLQVLSIFPEPALTNTGNHKEGIFESFLALSQPPFHVYLPQVRQLRELASNRQILRPDVLPVVASLPLLVHLEIFTLSIELDDDISLPENAFPSLQRLSVYLGSNQGVTDLWRIPALQQLTSLRIEFRDQHNDETDDPDNWARSLLSTIAKNSPNLRHLHVNFSLCDSCEDEPCDLGDPDLLEELSTLPLETVTLESAWFGIHDPDIFNYIPTAFSRVTELRMPTLNAPLNILAYFAKLPRLQHLVLDLYLTHGPEWNLPPAVPVGLALHTLETKDNCAPLGDLVSLAKNLLLLWPNLQRVVCPNDEITGTTTKLMRTTLISSLNTSITAIREATKLKKMIAEKYGPAELALFDSLPTVDYLLPDSKE